jgi:hypothetical protein
MTISTAITSDNISSAVTSGNIVTTITESYGVAVSLSASSATSNVIHMVVTFSNPVSGFAVGDITISAGGSLANFAGSGSEYTVDWTLASGANTFDIAADVCTSTAGGLGNSAAAQFDAGYLTMQPDSTADVDTVLKLNDSANYVTATSIWLGNIAGTVRRLLLRFDTTVIPNAATISSSVLTLNQEGENSSNARRIEIYRLERPFVMNQASYYVYSVGVDGKWQTDFCDGANDREQTEWVGRNVTATEANGAKTFTLPVTAKADFGEYGWLVKLNDESADSYLMSTCNSTTAANRPKLVTVYYVNPSTEYTVPEMDTPYYFPEGWEVSFLEEFADLDAWNMRTGENIVYQDTVWIEANNTIREGGGLRQVGSDVLVDGKYQGALLISDDDYKYGYFECYCKLPTGYIWPAFFLYDEDRDDITVPKNEIDIFEILGTNIIYVTTHLSNAISYSYTKIWTSVLQGEYHKWGCYWDTDGITVYIDDFPIVTFPPEEMPTARLHILFQWSFDGFANPPTNVTFPAYFDVDWVKVWTKANR